MYTIKSYRNNLIISTFSWRLFYLKQLWWSNVRWEFVLLSEYYPVGILNSPKGSKQVYNEEKKVKTLNIYSFDLAPALPFNPPPLRKKERIFLRLP